MKRMKNVRILTVWILLIISFGAVKLWGQFAGGTGTETDPWQIETAEQLDYIRNYLGNEHSDKYFIQNANIDLVNFLWDNEENDYINNGSGWEPIGTEENSFFGKYNGNGFTVNNLYIDSPEENFQGLFGKIEEATISNLGLTNVSIIGNYTVGTIAAVNSVNSEIRNCFSQGSVLGLSTRVGGLVGTNESSLIVGSYSMGNVTGDWITGGLAGYSLQGNIEDCYTTNNVTGVNDVGGLVGQINSSIILRCYATGDISGSSGGGGLIGSALGSSTIDCFSTGSVSMSGNYVGGLIGNNGLDSYVNKCYSSGNVYGDASIIGGLVGQNYRSTISNSYSSSAVQGLNRVGGLVGFNFGSYNLFAVIENSYSVGHVRGEDQSGGLVGFADTGQILSSYWNLESSSQLESSGGTGLTTSAMTDTENFVNWNFDTIWMIEEGVHYPYLEWQESASSHNYPGPISLTSNIDNESIAIELQWQLAIGIPLRFNVYRNNIFLDSVNYPEMEYLDANAPEAIELTYYVTSVLLDHDNNEVESSSSNRVFVGPLVSFGGGNGTENDPWQISSAEQLNNIRNYLGEENRFKHYIQTTEIDLSDYLWDEEEEEYINEGRGWLPIGEYTPDRTNFFSGNYNGNGHSIKGLYINRPQEYNIGLFGYTEEVSIKNLGLFNVFIEGGSTIGGLIGYGYSNHFRPSRLENCYVTGQINALETAGGLVGRLGYYAEIENCYSRVDISGDYDTGGLVGYAASVTIIHSYSSSTIEQTMSSGGLQGAGMGVANNSYWDMETSGQVTSVCGEGRTTQEMTYPYGENTYVNWDFENIWVEDFIGEENDGYPGLYFQIHPHPQIAVNPLPADQIIDVSLDLEYVSWEYNHNSFYATPIGFKVYLNETGNFDSESYVWIPYIDTQIQYSSSQVLPDILQSNTVYYWQVVPTTQESINRLNRRLEIRNNLAQLSLRDDHIVPVWRFTTGETSNIEDEASDQLVNKLHKNYPNPFNPTTTISFTLAKTEKVAIKLFNLRGQKLICLVDDYYQAGNHKIVWNGIDDNNNKIASGIYLYRMKTENYTEVNTLIMLK